VRGAGVSHIYLSVTDTAHREKKRKKDGRPARCATFKSGGKGGRKGEVDHNSWSTFLPVSLGRWEERGRKVDQ